MKFADLHVHTIFSDGTSTPAELISAAREANIDAVSVTDHDTVAGIGPATEIGLLKNVEVIPGIELTAEFEGAEVHILGYLLDYNNQVLLDKLQEVQNDRVERVYKIAGKLREIGVALDPRIIFDIAGKGIPGRLHIARAMVKEGIVENTFEAFRKYLGDKSPAFVLGFRFQPADAISLIRSVGGIPVLAHPYLFGRDEFIPLLVEKGLMGLEVYYTEHSQSQINYYRGLAEKYRLLITGGSDFHGGAKQNIRVGEAKIPYELVEKLKDAKQKLT